MKILCNFDALCFHSLTLLEMWNKISQGTKELAYVPLDAEIVSYMSATCSHKQVILTVKNASEEYYCQKFVDFMRECESDISFTCVYADRLSNEYVTESVDTVITNDLSIMRKYSHATHRVFVSDIFRCLWFLISFRGEKVVKNKYLRGFVSMPILYFIECAGFVLASTMYMVFVRMGRLNLNLCIPHFFSSILFTLYFKSLCELVNLSSEWKSQQNLQEPRCSNQFIEGSNDVLVGTFYVIFFLVCSLVYAFRNPQGSLMGLATGILYAISYNFSFFRRFIVAIVTSVFSYLLVKVS